MSNSQNAGSDGARSAARLISFGRAKIDQHSTALIALAIRAGAVLAGFAVTFLIGRQFGAAANGQFALIAQTALFLAVVGLIGLEVGVVRHFAKAVAMKAPLAPGTVFRVTAAATGLIAIIALALSLGGDFVWLRLFGNEVPRTFLLVLCVLLFGRAATQLLGGMLRSQHRFELGQIVAALSIPLITAAALISGLANSAEEALWAAAAGAGLSIVIAGWAMRRHIARGPDALSIPLRTILVSSVPLWGVGIANNIGEWYGLAVAAVTFGAAEAGIYRVAVQIAMSLQIISIALFSVYSAKISTAFHAGDTRQVALLARSAVRLSTAAALPMAAVLLVASDFILGLIGEEFRAALPLVQILIVGQLAFTLTGPCGLVLAMSGHEKINLAITICGTIVLLVCVPIAARVAGLAGIAMSISAILLLRNVFAYWVVGRKLGISIWKGTVALRERTSPQ
jgi:O-antigen/teichoic acid export membrane protein